ncbi:hypothetical protein ACQKWADRAFT_285845 [Trichoderma austrokoningii]
MGTKKMIGKSVFLAFAVVCVAIDELQTERYSALTWSYQAIISAGLNRRFDPSVMLQPKMSQLSQLHLFGQDLPNATQISSSRLL